MFFCFLFFLLQDICFTILSWFMLYINMNQPQMYIYSLQIYLRNTVDSVSDHYNKANITKKKNRSYEFFGSPVLPMPLYLRMVKTFIHVWQRALLQPGFPDRSKLHRMLFERLFFQLSWGNTANTLVLLLMHRTFRIKSLTKPQLRRASLVAQLVKNPPAMQETPVWFLGWEDPLEKG